MKKTGLVPIKPFSLMEKPFEDLFKLPEIPSFSIAEPRIHTTENSRQIRIQGKIPGLKKGDISVRKEGHSLVIEGERQEEKNSKEKGGIRQTLSYESFKRVMPIPEGTDIRHMKTTVKDGSINIIIPKKGRLIKAA